MICVESLDKNCDSLFSRTISKSNKPLIGLEYIIEFDDCNNVLRPFYCTLCDTHCNELELVFHLTTHEHMIKYLVSFFLIFIEFIEIIKHRNGTWHILLVGGKATVLWWFKTNSPKLYGCDFKLKMCIIKLNFSIQWHYFDKKKCHAARRLCIILWQILKVFIFQGQWLQVIYT